MSNRNAENQRADQLWADYSRSHDPRTREAIIQQFAPLAHSLAHRFASRRSADEDLQQVALLGLVKAVDRFDASANVRFITFATPTIVGELRHHVRDHSWHMRVPRGLQELALQVRRAEGELAERLGRQPTPAEIGARLEVAEEKVREAQALRGLDRPLSLDGAMESAEGDGSLVLEASLGREDLGLKETENRLGVTQALERLEERLRQVIQLRYLAELTQREVARRLGVSPMQICRLERRALTQLRQQFTVA